MRKMLALLVLLTLGCATTPHPQIAFLLQPPPSHPPCTRKLTLTLAPLTADAPYDTPLMAYSLSPLEVEFYAYHRWAAPLPRLITQAVREEMERWKCVTLMPYSPLHPVLQGRILRFLHRFRDGQSWGEVTISYTLVQGDRILARRTFQARTKAEENTPKGGALALNQALGKTMGELMRWLERIEYTDTE